MQCAVILMAPHYYWIINMLLTSAASRACHTNNTEENNALRALGVKGSLLFKSSTLELPPLVFNLSFQTISRSMKTRYITPALVTEDKTERKWKKRQQRRKTDQQSKLWRNSRSRMAAWSLGRLVFYRHTLTGLHYEDVSDKLVLVACTRVCRLLLKAADCTDFLFKDNKGFSSEGICGSKRRGKPLLDAADDFHLYVGLWADGGLSSLTLPGTSNNPEDYGYRDHAIKRRRSRFPLPCD